MKKELDLNQLAYETLISLRFAGGEQAIIGYRRASRPEDTFKGGRDVFEGWVSLIEKALRRARDSR